MERLHTPPLFHVVNYEDEMQIKQQGNEMYQLICFGTRDCVWIYLLSMLK